MCFVMNIWSEGQRFLVNWTACRARFAVTITSRSKWSYSETLL